MEFNYNNNDKLERNLIKRFKEYIGRNSDEFCRIERIFHNTQKRGEYKFREMLQIQEDFNKLEVQ